MIELSAASLIAASGLTEHRGVSLNPNVVASIQQWTETPVIAAIQEAIQLAPAIDTASPYFLLNQLGASTKPWVTGVAPGAAEYNVASTTLLPDYEYYNKIGSSYAPFAVSYLESMYPRVDVFLQSRAAEYLGHGDLSGFVSLIARVQGFSSLSASYMKSVSRAKTSIAAVGTGIYSDYSSIATAGFTQLSSRLDLLAEDLVNLGRYGNFSALNYLGHPSMVIMELYDNQLLEITKVDKLLAATGLSGTNLFEAKPSLVRSILAQCSSESVMKLVTEYFGILTPVSSLSDLNIAEILFPLSHEFNRFNTLDELGVLLQQIGNLTEVESYSALGTVLLSMNTVDDMSELNSVTDMIDDSVTDVISESYGGGTGEYGNIVINDMIGSLAGVNAEYFAQYVNTNSSNDTDLIVAEVNLISRLFQGEFTVTETDPITGDLIVTYDVPAYGVYSDMPAAFLDIATTVENRISTCTDYDKVAGLYIALFNQLSREQLFLLNANISPSTFVPADKMGIMVFASNLETVNKEVADYLRLVSAADKYGDAIKVAVASGENKQLLEAAGITNIMQG